MPNPVSLIVAAVLALSLPFLQGARDAAPAPRNAAVCDLSATPQSFNHARVRVTGIATYEFENFSLSTAECGGDDRPPIWLTFGGRVSPGTIYCCPGEGERRTGPLVIEGITLPLLNDQVFQRFRDLLLKRSRVVARTTLVGTFFAGEKITTSTASAGFGHFGCCTLLVIEAVERFEEIRGRADLN